MTTPSRTSTEQPTSFGAEDFTTGEGLRALLNRLFESGEDAWVTCFSSNVAFRGFDQSTPGGSGRWLWI